MLRRFAVAAVLSALFAGCLSAQPAFQKGMALGLYHADPDFSYTQQIEEIADLGATSVSLVIVWMQETTRSTEVYPVPERTVPEEKMIEAIRAAHAHGLEVMLFPIVLLQRPGEGEWRGRTNPDNMERWFASYRGRLMDLALIAEREGVEMLSIGSELSAIENQTDHWGRLIESVRSIYSGQMLYSANWDHLEVFEHWDRLDLIGLSAYFKLAEEPDVPEDWLDGAWMHYQNGILEWHRGHHSEMPLVLTEVGYASQDGASVHPWDYTRHDPIDLEEQRRCYAAFVRVWDAVPELRGVYFYEWGNGEGGPEDDSYTPRGKPAEQVIRDWYREDRTPGPPSYE